MFGILEQYFLFTIHTYVFIGLKSPEITNIIIFCFF